jgi:hypothetical protein
MAIMDSYLVPWAAVPFNGDRQILQNIQTLRGTSGAFTIRCQGSIAGSGTSGPLHDCEVFDPRRHNACVKASPASNVGLGAVHWRNDFPCFPAPFEDDNVVLGDA